jgi:hypothetical protein
LRASAQFPQLLRALHPKVITIEQVKIEQSANEQRIYQQPDRPAPVGVASKHSAVELRRQILNFVFFLSDMEHKRVIEVIAGKGTNAAGSAVRVPT